MAAPVVTNIGAVQSKPGTANTTTALVLTAAVPIGSTIVVSFAYNPAATTAVTAVDNATGTGNANTYTQRVAAVQGSGTTGVRTVILTAPVTRALAVGNTITITHPSLISRAASAIAATNLNNASLLDATGTAQGSTGTTFQGQVTTVADETLVIAAVGLEGVTADTFEIDRSYREFARIGTTGGNANTNIAIQGGTRYFTKPNTYIHSSTGTARLYSVAMLALKVTTGSLGPFSGQVNSTVETVDVGGTGDVADDAAIWVHPTTPANSVVIACDKDTAGNGGLYVHSMTGARLNIARSGNAFNNIDIRYNFPLGAGSIDLIGATNQTTRDLEFFSIDPTARTLTQVGTVATGMTTVYGFCLYRSTSGVYHAFVTADDLVGELKQFQLDGSSGSVTGTQVRTFNVGSLTEGLTADDAQDVVYVGEETGGVWKYSANPNGGSIRTLLDGVGNGRLTADVEGLAIYPRADGAGYLIVTSQGSSTFAIYDRVAPNTYLGSFSVVGGAGTDLVTITDGIDVSNRPLGAGNFANGMFVAHDSTNAGGTTSNFKYVPWSSIATLGGLATDTTFDPRTPVIPLRSGTVSSSFGRLVAYASNYTVTADREFTFEFTNSFASTLTNENERQGTIASSFKALTAAAAAARTIPARLGAVAASIKPLTAVASATRMIPDRGGIVDASFKALTATSAAVHTIPTRSTAVSSSLSALAATAVGTREIPARSGVTNASFYSLSASTTAQRTIPVRSGNVSSSLAVLSAAAISGITTPIRNGAAASSFSALSAVTTADRTIPARTGTVAPSFTPLTSTATASTAIPERSGAVFSSIAALTAESASNHVVPARAGTVVASFAKPTASASASRTQPQISGNEFSTEFSRDFAGGVGPWFGDAESSFARLSAAADVTAQTPERAASVESSFAALSAISVAERTIPTRSGNANSAFAILSATSVATHTIPTRSGDATAFFPPLSASSTAGRTIPVRTATAEASFYALIADAVALRSIQARYGDISSSFLTLTATASSDTVAATRLYLPSSGTADISPAFDAAWNDTAAVTRRLATRTKGTSAFLEVARAETSTSNLWDVALGQFISLPLQAQTITGNVQSYVRARESNTAANARSQMVVRVVSGDGTTVRGTLLSHNSAIVNENEWVVSANSTGSRNARFPNTAFSNVLTPVTASLGDRLVIEVGGRGINTGSTSYTLALEFGEASATDLPENETNTTQGNPWVEFSGGLRFQNISRSGSVGSSLGLLSSSAAVAREYPARSGTVSSSFLQLASSAAAARTIPDRIGSSASSFAPLSAASSAERTIPDRSGAVAATFWKLSVSSTAERTIPNRAGTVTSSLLPLSASVTVTQVYPERPVTVASSFGWLSASSIASRAIPNRTAGVGSAFATVSASASAQRVPPARNAQVNSSFQRVTVTSSANRIPAPLSAIVTASFSKVGASVSVVRNLPAPVDASVSSSFRKLSISAQAETTAPVIQGASSVTLPAPRTISQGDRTIPQRNGTSAVRTKAFKSTGTGTRTVPIRFGTSNVLLSPIRSTAQGRRVPPPISGPSTGILVTLRTNASGSYTKPARSGQSSSHLYPIRHDALGIVVLPHRTGTSTATIPFPVHEASGRAIVAGAVNIVQEVWLTGSLPLDVYLSGTMEPDVYLSGTMEPDIYLTATVPVAQQ